MYMYEENCSLVGCKYKNWHFINKQNINDNTKPLSVIPCNDIIACSILTNKIGNSEWKQKD